ncbi:MAG: transposase [Candidatus Solibacter sp.]
MPDERRSKLLFKNSAHRSGTNFGWTWKDIANARHFRHPRQRRVAAISRLPASLQMINRFKQSLCYLLLKKHRTCKQCVRLIPRLLAAIQQIRQARLPQLVVLGETLESWKEEIACMWRFTRNNSITEGFHNKMETISRVAFGFRNFENYRQRVKVLCS